MQKPAFNELQKIELAETLFGIDFPVDVKVSVKDDLTLENPRELVDYFVLQLEGWGPNPAAADFLKKMAKNHQSPALAEGLHASWRRDQISAVIREIFNTGGPSTGGDDDALLPVEKPRLPKTGHGAVAQDLDEDS
jgi:hypothetical protein